MTKILNIFSPCDSYVIGFLCHLIFWHWTQRRHFSHFLHKLKPYSWEKPDRGDSRLQSKTINMNHVVMHECMNACGSKFKRKYVEKPRGMSSAVAQLLTWSWGSQLTHQTPKHWWPRSPHIAVTTHLYLSTLQMDSNRKLGSSYFPGVLLEKMHLCAFVTTHTHTESEHWHADMHIRCTKTSIVGFNLLYTPVRCSIGVKRDDETRSLLSLWLKDQQLQYYEMGFSQMSTQFG